MQVARLIVKFLLVPILDRPEERSQCELRNECGCEYQFQSSIAPKNDRNFGADLRIQEDRVPILDRPEERSQSGPLWGS